MRLNLLSSIGLCLEVGGNMRLGFSKCDKVDHKWESERKHWDLLKLPECVSQIRNTSICLPVNILFLTLHPQYERSLKYNVINSLDDISSHRCLLRAVEQLMKGHSVPTGIDFCFSTMVSILMYFCWIGFGPQTVLLSLIIHIIYSTCLELFSAISLSQIHPQRLSVYCHPFLLTFVHLQTCIYTKHWVRWSHLQENILYWESIELVVTLNIVWKLLWKKESAGCWGSANLEFGPKVNIGGSFGACRVWELGKGREEEDRSNPGRNFLSQERSVWENFWHPYSCKDLGLAEQRKGVENWEEWLDGN